MKENQKRLLVSLVAGSALSLTLGITVHADGVDETEPVTIQTASLSPGEESKENAIEAGTHEGTGAGAADGTGEETDRGTDEGTADALLPEIDLNQTPPDSPVQNASALSFTGANQPGAASEENAQQTTVSVDGQKLTSGAADENGWDRENKTGWRYDGSSVSMVNNGSVAGVLDEQYTIPNGITLVVPAGGTLDMRVTTAVTEKTTMTDSPRRQGFFPRQLTSTVTSVRRWTPFRIGMPGPRPSPRSPCARRIRDVMTRLLSTISRLSRLHRCLPQMPRIPMP